MGGACRFLKAGASLTVILLLSFGAVFAHATATPQPQLSDHIPPLDSSGTTQSETHSQNETTTLHDNEHQNSTSSGTSTAEHTEQTSTNESSPGHSETETSHGTTEGHPDHELSFRVVPSLSISPPANYVVGTGEASMDLKGSTLFIHVELEHMNPTTDFAFVLTVNGTQFVVGNFTTSDEGDAKIEAQYTLNPGTYLIGFKVNDVSKPGFQVMASDPSSLPITIRSVSSSSSVSSSVTESEKLNPVVAGQAQENDINNAIHDKLIPAVIHLNDGEVNFTVVDPHFTLFVGKLQTGGLQITISAANVTGPRVLLVNLTNSQFINTRNGTVVVTFDGVQVKQASSIVQVFAASSSPLFVLVQTSAGYQLLISIPHFSVHVIQIFTVALSTASAFLSVNGPLLLLSSLVVTSAFAAVYARRHRALT